MSLFRDRKDAGRQFAKELEEYKEDAGAIVLVLPRGGVPVAYEIANHLGLPLEVFIVRKLGVPGHEELAMGAIATGGVKVMNEDIVKQLNISEDLIDVEVARERLELQRREELYRGSKEFPSLKDKTVILVDDGLATGASMRAATVAIKKLNAKKIFVAVPVASKDTCKEFSGEVDEVVCLHTPDAFMGVGAWYDDFSQTTDDEVRELLNVSQHASG